MADGVALQTARHSTYEGFVFLRGEVDTRLAGFAIREMSRSET